MEIFNVLLADDDYLILQNLQKLIDWNKCGFRIIGTASNGKEAVKLIKKEHPAVLITDVIMPVMNGLELVSQVRKDYPDIKILMLSSYDEFDYVKQAIAAGVTDYILKSEINPISFSSKISQIYGQLSSERFITSAATSQELSIYFESGETPVSQNPTHALYKLYTKRYQFFIFSQSCCFETDVNHIIEHWKSSAIALYSIVREIEELKNADILFTWKHYCIAGIPLETSCNSRRNLVDTFSRKALYNVNSLAAHPCTLFYAHKPLTPPELRNFFILNQNIFQYYSYFPEQKPLLFSFLENNGPKTLPKNSFDFHLLSNSSEHLEEDILSMKHFLSHCLEQKNAYALSTFYINFSTHCQENAISYFQTPEYYLKWIFNTYENYLKKSSNQSNQNLNNATAMAIDFIQKNFSNCNLSVADISSHVSLSEGRLGVLFKSDTGKTINEYVTDTRIKNAEYLLTNTTMKIYEISDQCGYKSSQYFSQIFYQKTGKRPIDFRRK